MNSEENIRSEEQRAKSRERRAESGAGSWKWEDRRPDTGEGKFRMESVQFLPGETPFPWGASFSPVSAKQFPLGASLFHWSEGLFPVSEELSHWSEGLFPVPEELFPWGESLSPKGEESSAILWDKKNKNLTTENHREGTENHRGKASHILCGEKTEINAKSAKNTQSVQRHTASSLMTEENAGMQECGNAVETISIDYDSTKKLVISTRNEERSETKEAACYGFLSRVPGIGMTEENAKMQECGNAVETISIDYDSTKKLVISTRNEERSATNEAACYGFLIAFGMTAASRFYSTACPCAPLNPLKGAARKDVLQNEGVVCWDSPLGVGGSVGIGMTEENAEMQECRNAGMSAAHSYQIEGLHPACHLEGRMTERSAANEAACYGFLIAFGMTAASCFKKKYSTVFYSKQLVIFDLKNAFRLPQTSGTGEPVFTSFSSNFPLWGNTRREGGTTEELAIRACDLLLFNN